MLDSEWRWVLASLTGAVLAAAPALAQPAPDWLRNAEMVTSWDRENKTTDQKRLSGIPLLINVQGKAGIDDAHAKGFRGIPYTSSMDGFVDERGIPPRTGRFPIRPETSNALLVDQDGRFVDTLMDGTYRLHRKLVCANSTTFQKVMMEFLREDMDAGMDGLFIDNVSARRAECYGDGLKIGYSSRYHTILAEARNVKFQDPRLSDVPVHQHIYPGRSHDYAFRQWLLKVREMVKSYGPDKITLINGGVEYADCADGTMIESYICSWAWKGRRLNWQQLKDLAGKYGPYLSKGGVVVALSYLGQTQSTVKDDAFFCYAAARLSGFIWSDYRTLGDDPATILYRSHPGPAVTPVLAASPGVEYRWHRDGLIAINGTDQPAELKLTVPAAQAGRVMSDLYEDRKIPIRGGKLSLSMPAQSGRIYLAR